MAEDIGLNIRARFQSEGGDQFAREVEGAGDSLLELAEASEAAERALTERYSLAAEATAENTRDSITALNELQTVMRDMAASQDPDIRGAVAGVNPDVSPPASVDAFIASHDGNQNPFAPASGAAPHASSLSNELVSELERQDEKETKVSPAYERFDTRLQDIDVTTRDEKQFGKDYQAAESATRELKGGERQTAESELVSVLGRHREALDELSDRTREQTEQTKSESTALAIPSLPQAEGGGGGFDLGGIGQELQGMGMGNIGRLGQAGGMIGRFAKFLGPAGMAATAGAAAVGTAKAGIDFLGRGADQGRDLATAYNTLDKTLGLRGESMMAAANGFDPDQSEFGVADRFAGMNATITDVGRFASMYDSVGSQASEGYDPASQATVLDDGTVLNDRRSEQERYDDFSISNRGQTREMRLMDDVASGIELSRVTGTDQSSIAQLMQRGNRSGTFDAGDGDAFGRVVFEAVRSGTKDGVSSSETFASMESYLGDMASRGIEGSVDGLANMALLQEQLRQTGSRTLSGEQGTRALDSLVGGVTAQGDMASEVVAQRALSGITGEELGLEGGELDTFNDMSQLRRGRVAMEKARAGNQTALNRVFGAYEDMTGGNTEYTMALLTDQLGLSSTQALELTAEGGFSNLVTDPEALTRYTDAELTQDDVSGGADSTTRDMYEDAERKDFLIGQTEAFKNLTMATQGLDVALAELTSSIEGSFLSHLSGGLQDDRYSAGENEMVSEGERLLANRIPREMGQRASTETGRSRPQVETFGYAIETALDAASDTAASATSFDPALGQTYGALDLNDSSLIALNKLPYQIGDMSERDQRSMVRNFATEQMRTLEREHPDISTNEAVGRSMGALYGQPLDVPVEEYPEALRGRVGMLQGNIAGSFETGFNGIRQAFDMPEYDPADMPINQPVGSFNDYDFRDYNPATPPQEGGGGGMGNFFRGVFGLADASAAPAAPQPGWPTLPSSSNGFRQSTTVPINAPNNQQQDEADIIGEAVSEPLEDIANTLESLVAPQDAGITMTPPPLEGDNDLEDVIKERALEQRTEMNTTMSGGGGMGGFSGGGGMSRGGGAPSMTPRTASGGGGQPTTPAPSSSSAASTPRPASSPTQTPAANTGRASGAPAPAQGIDPSVYDYGTPEFFVASALKAEAEGAAIDPAGAAAQAILESGWGKSGLAQTGQNFFGIKAGSSWEGPTVNLETSEYTAAGEHYRTDADWRAYDDPSQSFADYGDLISGLDRYQGAEDAVDQGLGTRAYLEQVKAGGYATDPDYVNKVMGVVEGRDLEGLANRMREQYGGGSASQAGTQSAPAPSSSAGIPLPSTQPTSTPPASGEGSSYTIRPGDTLSAIASRHGTTVSALASNNNISDPSRISVGQSLHIGANPYRSTAAKLLTDDGSDIIRGASDENLGNNYASNTDRETLDRWMGMLTTSSNTNEPLTQEFGTSDFIKNRGGGRYYGRFGGRHPGVDYDFGDYAEITTPFAGIAEVTLSNASTGYGNRVIVHGASGESMLFGHLNEVAIEDGDEVTPGQILGTQGNTGAGTGSHLHYEWRDAEGNYRDPNKMLTQRDERLEGGTLEQGQFAEGGYTGPGGKFEVAGAVHRGEFVVKQEQTDKHRDLLEAINRDNVTLEGTPEQGDRQRAEMLERAVTRPSETSQGALSRAGDMNITVTFGGAIEVSGSDGEGGTVAVPEYMQQSLERFAKERISPHGAQMRRSGR